MKKTLLVFILALLLMPALFLAGCPGANSPESPASPGAPAPTSSFTFTLSPTSPATPSPTRTPTATFTGTLAATSTPTPTPTATPSSSPTNSPTNSPTPTVTQDSVTVLSNQTIAGHPHTMDYYLPSNATSAVIFLHGGGGQKESCAYGMGIKQTNSNADYAVSSLGESWLIANRVLMVFPQGQAISSNPGAWTWSNYVMTSGVDDVAFLQDLVAALKADPSLSGITKFYLAGHSNGGMMANRMWCESPSTFDAYGALAGPAATHMDIPSGSNVCSPSVVKPYIGIIGDSDTCLSTTGNMAVTHWLGNPVLYAASAAAWVDGPSYPRYLNEVLFYGKRTNLKCAGVPAAPVTSGQLVTYSDCSGTLKLIVVNQATIALTPTGGDHCILNASGPCITTLVGNTGLDLKSTLFDFFKNF